MWSYEDTSEEENQDGDERQEQSENRYAFAIVRAPFGSEWHWKYGAPSECPGCGVEEGDQHEDDCEYAECEECGELASECRCCHEQ